MLYSLEELCYYINRNIYVITEEFFTSELIDWIQEEIGHPTLSNKCRKLLDRETPDLKDLVVTVLCASDYYREKEIRDVADVLDNIVNLPYHARMKIKSDNCLKYGRYGKAAVLYKKLLKGSFAVNFTPEEYGDILHNLAISLFYVSSFRESSGYFKEAYIRNHNKESAKHYLYVLLMEGDESVFRSEALEMGFSSEECKQMVRDVEAMKPSGDLLSFSDDFVTESKDKLRKAFV
jgi:hypothetical protein